MENLSESEASSSIDHDLSTSELWFDFEKHSESLTCGYEDLDSLLLRKKQPHIKGKELKRKKKRKCIKTLSK